MSTGYSSVTLHKSCRMKLRICLSSFLMSETRLELIGLDSTWLDPILLDWSRLDSTGLYSTRFYSIRFHFTPLNVTGLDFTWLHSLESFGLDSTWLDSIRLALTPFDFTGLDSNWLYSTRNYWDRGTVIPGSHLHRMTYTRWCIDTIRFSWWWAQGCSKHVEKWNK